MQQQPENNRVWRGAIYCGDTVEGILRKEDSSSSSFSPSIPNRVEELHERRRDAEWNSKKKKEKEKKGEGQRKEEKDAHTFVAMHKGSIYGLLLLLQVKQRGELLTCVSFEIAESFARKRSAVQAGCGQRKEKEFVVDRSSRHSLRAAL